MSLSMCRRENVHTNTTPTAAPATRYGVGDATAPTTRTAMREPAYRRLARYGEAFSGSEPAFAGAVGHRCSSRQRGWRRRESNPRPPACKAGALPTELHPRAERSLFRRRRAGTGPVVTALPEPNRLFLRC